MHEFGSPGPLYKVCTYAMEGARPLAYHRVMLSGSGAV